MNRDIFELTLTLLQAKVVHDEDKGFFAYKKIFIEEISYFEKALKLGKLYKELSIIRLCLFSENDADEGQRLIDRDTEINKQIKKLFDE